MKKALFAGLVLSLLIACSKKDIFKWVGKPGNPKPSVPCKIDSIYPTTPTDILLHSSLAVGIHYNNQGNPAVLNYHLLALMPYPEKFAVYYKYDNKNRLIEVDPPEVDPVHMEILAPIAPHKFVYQGNSQLPVRDSILSDTFFGVSEGVAYKAYTVKVEDLYYDAHGRINRVVSRREYRNTLNNHVESSNYEMKFTYDNKGNRQVLNDGSGNTPPAISYTNKPSLYSLHPVWQLVHKNWSKNAAVENIQTYNNYGLPVKGDMNGSRFLETRNVNSDGPFLKIDYTCM